MSRRDEWRNVLACEIKRLSAQPWQALFAQFREPECYEVVYDNKTYQVEVEILENTEQYLHLSVAVDDGIPQSIIPSSTSFFCPK